MNEHQKRYKHLKSLGFDDEVIKIWEKTTPKLFTEKFVDAKIKGLEERGFENPVKMIVSLPAILGLAFENIDAKIKGLEERGFENPVKMIVSLPAILGLAFENIDAKIKGLEERGFENPVKMIVSLPAILGYAFENIDAKIKYAKKLRRFGVDGLKIAEAFPPLLGYSIKRIRFFVRIVLSLSDGDDKIFISLMTQEPLAVAAGRLEADGSTKKNLRRNIRSKKGRKLENIEMLSQKTKGKIAKAYLRYKIA